jgi:hypothetical protein
VLTPAAALRLDDVDGYTFLNTGHNQGGVVDTVPPVVHALARLHLFIMCVFCYSLVADPL